MIVDCIQGGLGNQMFQYAFGFYLAENNGAELLLDSSSFEADPLRVYMLDRWTITAAHVGDKQRRLFPRRYGGWGRRNYLLGKRPLKRIIERPLGFHPKFLHAGDHVYLLGYWQSEQFFPGMRDRLRCEFQPAGAMSDETLAIARNMARPQSASLHVRRTDYLQVSYTSVCSIEYYRRSVDDLLQRHEGVHLFVFSDDLLWSQQHLRFPCPTTFVTHNDGATAHEDLWLMTQCKHHVVANSSFSWWGAWLGVDESGSTYAPDPWFTGSEINCTATVPASWRRAPIIVPGNVAA